MNMHRFTMHTSLLGITAALAFGAAACASQPVPPPVAAAPPAQAFQQAASGLTAPQGDPQDGVQFVDQERKEPQVHEDLAATALQPNDQHPHR